LFKVLFSLEIRDRGDILALTGKLVKPFCARSGDWADWLALVRYNRGGGYDESSERAGAAAAQPGEMVRDVWIKIARVDVSPIDRGR
jgi:hypothetical protein